MLAIDDDPEVHEFITEVLSEEGYRVEHAMSGEEGLKMAKKLRPDFITLDVLMPGMDGWTVLSLLKEDPDVSNTPVIILSMRDDRDFGFAMGVSAYLKKPTDKADLVATLQRFHREPHSNRAVVVEGDVSTRETLGQLLGQEGWQVDVAEHGREAMGMISRQLPGLIIIDLLMPGTDRFEMIAELQKKPEWKKIPVIVIGAEDLTQEDHERLKDSVLVILKKGAFNRTELLTDIRDFAGMIASVK